MAELETQLLLCVRLSLLTESDIAQASEVSDEVGKMIRGLQHRLNEKQRNS